MLTYILTPINEMSGQPGSRFLKIAEYNGGLDLVQVAGFYDVVSPTQVTTSPTMWEFKGLPFNATVSPTQVTHPLPSQNLVGQALGVNDIYPSDVVGWIRPGGQIPGDRAIRWKNGIMEDLGTLGGNWRTQARGVNNAGTIVGASNNAGEIPKAFSWVESRNPRMEDLGHLGGGRSEANAINNLGQIVGWSYDDTGIMRAFIWTPGGTDGDRANPQMKWLTDYNTGDSVALDINDKGHVVGWFLEAGIKQGFYWSSATGFKKLTNLGYSSVANSINGHDMIVGNSVAVSGNESRAVSWINFGISDLNSYVMNSFAWLLSDATGINSRGDIVCAGHMPIDSAIEYGILLTPILIYYPPHFPRVIKWPFYNVYDPNWRFHLWDHNTGQIDNPVIVTDVSFIAEMTAAAGKLKNEKIKNKIQQFLLKTISNEINKRKE